MKHTQLADIIDYVIDEAVEGEPDDRHVVALVDIGVTVKDKDIHSVKERLASGTHTFLVKMMDRGLMKGMHRKMSDDELSEYSSTCQAFYFTRLWDEIEWEFDGASFYDDEIRIVAIAPSGEEMVMEINRIGNLGKWFVISAVWSEDDSSVVTVRVSTLNEVCTRLLRQ